MENRKYELIAAYIGNELAEKDRQQFEQELGQDSELNEMLNESRFIWNNSSDFEVPEFDQFNSYNKIENELNKRTKIRKLYQVARIAALLLVGIFGGYLINYIHVGEEDQYVEISVNAGEKIQITLPDGNKIWINSNSTLRYPADFSSDDRKVFLEGEAYFDLTMNPSSNLLVQSGNALFTCYNSSFNIKNNGVEEVNAVVEKGFICAYNGKLDKSNELIIAEGDKGVIKSDLLMFQAPNSDPNFLAWKTGKLSFENMPLIKVTDALSEYFGVSFEVYGKIKYCRFSSTYYDEKLDNILDDLKTNIKTEILETGNKIILIGEQC